MSDLPWICIQELPTRQEATLLAGFLRTQGIEVEIDSRRFEQEPVSFQLLGGVRVMIPEADGERARKLLAELENSPPIPPPDIPSTSS